VPSENQELVVYASTLKARFLQRSISENSTRMGAIKAIIEASSQPPNLHTGKNLTARIHHT
jgi:hypothetical protein